MKISFHLIKNVLKNKSKQNPIKIQKSPFAGCLKPLFFKILRWIQNLNKKPVQSSRINLFLKFKKRSLFIVFSLFILPQILSAQNKGNTIWIKDPWMPFQEFKAHIKALGHPHISYAQYLLIQKRNQAKSLQLKNKLLSAQELYLSGEGERAVKAFQQISRQALLADWDEEDRRIILYSFLRQAQSAEDAEKRKALLLSASDFSLTKINELNYRDYHLFPPPLMDELEHIQSQSNTLLVDWKAIFPDHEIILINGKPLQNNEKIKIPQAFYRISVFSSSHRPWSQRLNLSELLTQKIKTQSLTRGTCGNPYISSDEKETNIKIFPFSACPPSSILSFEKSEPTKAAVQKTFTQKTIAKNSRSHTVNQLDNPHFVDSPLSYSKNFQDKLKELPSKKETLFSNVPSWVVFGAGVVILSLAISLSQSEKPPTTTTTTGDYIY